MSHLIPVPHNCKKIKRPIYIAYHSLKIYLKCDHNDTGNSAQSENGKTTFNNVQLLLKNNFSNSKPLLYRSKETISYKLIDILRQ